MSLILAMFIAYIIGSIPSGLIIGRFVSGVDLREHGSGNLGATNALRVLGRKYGAIVLFCDMFKGLVPVVLLPTIMHMKNVEPLDELLIGASAIIGHIYSVFTQFRGGKGVATALGVFLAIAPKEMLVVLALGLGIIGVTGFVSAAAVIGAILLPFLLYIGGKPLLVLLVAQIIALVVILRHTSNILRLFAGRELRVWDPVEHPGDDQEIPPTQ